MFHVKNHKQAYIFDPWDHLGPKRRKLLDDSWAGVFQQEILPVLPVDKLRKHYHDVFGRPTKELYSMMGLMILQQMFDQTDREAVEQFCFNIQWHYALNITSPQDSASYVSEKSLWTMRNLLITEGLQDMLFESTLARLAKVFKVDLEKQRIDSVHIKSNMRHLGRIGLFVKTIKKFLTNLKRQHRCLYDQLDKELIHRYMSKKKASLFAMVKPSESGRTLDQLASDVFTLTSHFSQVESVQGMSSFKLLNRLFHEQCVVEDSDEMGSPVAVARPNKDVSSDSLQNPSDPDAGYSAHKGQGYQVQVAETYSATEQDDQCPLLTYVEVESADKHDARALLPALDDLEERDMAPAQILADSLYGSDDNLERAARDHGVDVVSPVMPGNKKKIPLADFTLDEQGKILACPHGIEPDIVKPTKCGYSAVFPKASCLNCPDLKRCPVREGKKGCYYRYTRKDIRIARRQEHEKTPDFQERYRYRAGVEATMSEFDRRTGVKHLRVRGMKAVRFAAVMKAIGLNILRAARFRRRKRAPLQPHRGPCGALFAFCRRVKEQVEQFRPEITFFKVYVRTNLKNRYDFTF